MATSSAWVSVTVKCGQEVLCPWSVVKCSWDDNFGSLLTKVGGIDMEDRTMTKIAISRTEKFVDPTHVVPPEAPIILCEQFNCFHVCLYVSAAVSMETESAQVQDRRNAFAVLMAQYWWCIFGFKLDLFFLSLLKFLLCLILYNVFS